MLRLRCFAFPRSGNLGLPSGSSSAVERELPKLDVAGSIPVSRSNPSITYDRSLSVFAAPDRALTQDDPGQSPCYQSIWVPNLNSRPVSSDVTRSQAGP